VLFNLLQVFDCSFGNEWGGYFTIGKIAFIKESGDQFNRSLLNVEWGDGKWVVDIMFINIINTYE
jgi:hypothetical protein